MQGIVLFGAPCSGKTSVASLLQSTISNSILIEASRLVIFPTLSLSSDSLFVFPESRDQFIDLLLQSRIKNEASRVTTCSRLEGRNTFSLLANLYGSDFIGRVLERMIAYYSSENQILIVPGARGVENAKYLATSCPNILAVYLSVNNELSNQRMQERMKGETQGQSQDLISDWEYEENLYQTSKIEEMVALSYSSAYSVAHIGESIKKHFQSIECKKCLNSTLNPSTPIGENGLCSICNVYEMNYSESLLASELVFFKTFKGSHKPYDIMAGISGGKDSSAMLYTVKDLGFTPVAFTFDTGYYPPHIFTRSKEIADKLNVAHEVIKIIPEYLTSECRQCYEASMQLYDEPESDELSQRFLSYYAEGRKHYSVKDNTVMPFVRSCQLCRKVVIRAYYAEAVKRGLSVVVLGINEWTGLSSLTKSTGSHKDSIQISGIRKLQPSPDMPAVYIVHLPFLLKMTRHDTESIVRKIDWKEPDNEDFIESNSNSCLFAFASEAKAKRLLGFHPDITRLSREITSGFITRDEARKALTKRHNCTQSVRQILQPVLEFGINGGQRSI